MSMPSDEVIVPVRTYLGVWLALMGLLALTYGLYFLNLGPWNAVCGLAIAALKAALVVAVFMHLRHQPRLMWVWAGAGFYWLGLLACLTFGEYLTRGWPALPGT